MLSKEKKLFKDEKELIRSWPCSWLVDIKSIRSISNGCFVKRVMVVSQFPACGKKKKTKKKKPVSYDNSELHYVQTYPKGTYITRTELELCKDWTGLQVFNVTSALFVEETKVPGENHRPVVNNWHNKIYNIVCLMLVYVCIAIPKRVLYAIKIIIYNRKLYQVHLTISLYNYDSRILCMLNQVLICSVCQFFFFNIRSVKEL